MPELQVFFEKTKELKKLMGDIVERKKRKGGVDRRVAFLSSRLLVCACGWS